MRLYSLTIYKHVLNFHSAEDESAALQEIMHDSTLLSKCHLLLKCNKALCNNKNVAEGPAFARLSVFANTPASEANIGALVVRCVRISMFCM